MAISFNSIPSLRTPFVAIEFDNSKASQGPALQSYRVLLLGQKITAGSAAANSLTRVTSADQVLALAGRGSQLHRMAMKFFANNKTTECWIGAVADDGAATAGTKTITLTGPATASGTIALYLGGERVTVAVASGDAATAVATAMAAAINANLDLPVTAAAVSAVVTLTQRNKGIAGNDYDVRHSYQLGEKLPAGLTFVAASGVTGATNPVLSTLIAAMGDQQFTQIAHPYTDASSLTALETELLSRAGPLRQIDGIAVTSAAGTQSTISTLGDTRNSQYSSIAAQPGKNPLTPPLEFAAALTGVLAYYANIDPARPYQTLPLTGVLPPADADLFTLAERNLMLGDGISTTKVAAGGVVQIERLVTTYQLNAAGAVDPSYYDVTTILTLMYLRFSLRTQIQNRFPRHKLASDGGRLPAGQAIVTPQLMKAECLAWFRQMEDLGLVDGSTIDQFKGDLVVERDISDPNRLNLIVPPDLINALIVTAAQIQFRL